MVSPIIILRGGGDLASGVALRLHRVGLKVLITELPQPLSVRRLVSFSEAVYDGQTKVEGVTARLADTPDAVEEMLEANQIPVMIDPDCQVRFSREFDVCALIDARMTKKAPDLGRDSAPLVIGLGPGFVAGENCHAVIETNRGHRLGRVIWDGTPEADTGVPGKVSTFRAERVLRAPEDGILQAVKDIGTRVTKGYLIANVSDQPILAPFDGVLRGLVHDGLRVHEGMKVGDVDPRDDPAYAYLVSEKSLAIGGGVLEALLSRPEIRQRLWS